MSVSISGGACELRARLTRGKESFTGCGASLAAMMECGSQVRMRCLLRRSETWSSDQKVSTKPVWIARES